MRNSQQLRWKIEMVYPELAAAGRAILTHPRVGDLLPDYMFTVHCMIRASVPLMETALARCHALTGKDTVAGSVASYLAKHIPEEMRHDEWLLSDMEVLGRDRSEVLRRLPSPTVAAMVGSQYYWIFHCHPVALLGYIAVMEGYPPTVAQVEALVRASGKPREAFRTMLKHVHLDPRHRDDLNNVLDELPLTQAHSALIGLSALETVRWASRALREITEPFDVEARASLDLQIQLHE